MRNNELEELVVQEVDLLGFECVKCEVVGSNRHPVLRLYIDKPGGVSVGDCSRVNRTLGLVLDEKEPFAGRYVLEVSSPGSNRPLTTPEHFQRFVESEAKVSARVHGPDEGKMTYTGRIRSCIDGVITLDTDDGEITIAFDDVIGAQLLHQEYKIDKKMKKDKRSRGGVKREGGLR
jgi:ribosome maturation factor RimP